MLTFTIIMIFIFLITIFISETSRNILKNKEKLSEKEYNNQLGVMGCFMAVFTIPYLVLYFIYILKMLTIDPLFYPSVVMLGLYIFEILVGIIISIFRKKKEPTTKTRLVTMVTRAITALFYMYSLYVLIVGI